MAERSSRPTWTISPYSGADSRSGVVAAAPLPPGVGNPPLGRAGGAPGEGEGGGAAPAARAVLAVRGRRLGGGGGRGGARGRRLPAHRARGGALEPRDDRLHGRQDLGA